MKVHKVMPIRAMAFTSPFKIMVFGDCGAVCLRLLPMPEFAGSLRQTAPRLPDACDAYRYDGQNEQLWLG